jgi:hypothetical protein
VWRKKSEDVLDDLFFRPLKSLKLSFNHLAPNNSKRNSQYANAAQSEKAAKDSPACCRGSKVSVANGCERDSCEIH